MKQTTQPITQQFNLSLVSVPAIVICEDKQNELKCALVELLISAACPEGETEDRQRGGEDESQTNR
jgi:hypothetical protein